MKRIVLVLLLLLQSQLIMAATVGNMRVWTDPEKTRLVLELDEAVDYKLFTLANPERVVLDIKSASTGKGLPSKLSSGLLTQLRTGVRNGNDLRVVLDLKEKAIAKTFLLKPAANYPHRLVVDLLGKSGKTKADAPKPIKKLDENRQVLIAVDAGHGGEDPGAIGPKGTYEKNVTLKIAKKLVNQINREQGMKGFLVRTGDYYIPHRKRAEKAREKGADLFISIHADSFYNNKVKGSSVYILSTRGATSEAARWLAAKENSADLVGGVSLDDKDDVLASVLLDLSQTATHEASSEVASEVLKSIGKVNNLHKSHVESAAFLVLKSPDIPSILVETAFISNPTEEKRLLSSKHQDKLAAAVMNGVRTYLYRKPPPGTMLASMRSNKSHTVSTGETLSGIAHRYSVSLNTLKAVNQLRSDLVRVGDVLLIPAASG